LLAADQSWTNSSVIKFAEGRDPVQMVVQVARDIVLEAIDRGWSGTPFDPMKLADLRGLAISPRGDIRDARTVPAGHNRFLIEYNPNRPSGRLRYSIAHEIAHTFFPDCGDRIRNRTAVNPGAQTDDWQLEALCNIAAAEILMPMGSLKVEEVANLDINRVAEIRKKFDVSTEAILMRLANLSDRPCAVFVASQWDGSRDTGTYKFDYVIPTRSWAYHFSRGIPLPSRSPVAECTAIGFTAKGVVEFPGTPETLHIECIGIPPYPRATFPRVAGVLFSEQAVSDAGIAFLRGNALEPRGSGTKLIAHIVSDATANWGGRGFAIALMKKWPSAQAEFRTWAASRRNLRLGEVHFADVAPDIKVASMVCQHGYGESPRARLRYMALETALKALVPRVAGDGMSVHIPRIGTGQAGGSWMMVQELIAATLLAANVSVTVYDLPEQRVPAISGQLSLTPVE